MSIILFTLSLSLFDSLYAVQQIIVFSLLLTTIKPLRNSISYLAGYIIAYFSCGIAGYIAIDRLHSFISRYFPTSANLSNALYYKTEMISGIIMILIGIFYYLKKRHAPPGRSHNIILSKLKSINGFYSFVIGMLLSLSVFPFSIPYLIALGKYTSLHLDFHFALVNILLYNIGYSLPMLLILIIYLYARNRKKTISDSYNKQINMLNVQLTTWTLVAVGIFSALDAGFYFTIGHAILKSRLF